MWGNRFTSVGYIQMSSMILGGMIEADSGMRRYEQRVRMQRMMARDGAMRQELLDEDEEFAATATETSTAKK
ncbi:hypothetical protein NUW58_g6274 [Xylaria curta]|uniref:Uncharacterized protein n=1 Tax=Xylaria curta TaxID=42375 RepID=A0ACC1NWQ8_9PEZI|nr:hypothetical protein NUW58_g6274 [Xylaria curta]